MENRLLQWISTAGRLLGAVFYYEPQNPAVQPVLAFFKQPDWRNEWTELAQAEQIESLIRRGLKQDLSEAYQFLFIGPNDLPAPPWGSVYLDKESVIFGDSLLALRTFLQRYQIAFTAHTNEPEDHIGLMLMLTAYLAERKPGLTAEFLARHLLPWAYHYLDLLAEQRNYPFYQGMALLAKETLAGWQRAEEIQPADLQLYR